MKFAGCSPTLCGMRCRFRGDRGAVTAEFALALPAVAVVLALCLMGVQVIGLQVRVQDAASVASRSMARGDGPEVAWGRASALVPGATLQTSQRGDLECATVSARASLGIVVSAFGCALGGSP